LTTHRTYTITSETFIRKEKKRKMRISKKQKKRENE